jgi:TolA-binding protein
MECQELHRDVLAEKYLGGHLDPAARDAFEVHLLECAHCLTQVEAIQAVRQELAERAPQIRAYSQVEHSRFRWQWATVVAFVLVVCGLGIVEFQKIKTPQSAKLQDQPFAPAPPATGPNTVPAVNSPQASSSTPAIDDRPVNGRVYIDFSKTDSRVARDKAPSTGLAPTAGLNIEGQRAHSNLVRVDGADAAADSLSGDRSSASPPAVASSPTPSISSKPPVLEVASDEIAKELFRLGTVPAPPYTFSGVSSSSGHDFTVGPAALSGKHSTSPTNQPRPLFRDAMDAYVDQRYADASDLLERAAHAEPKAPDVNFYLGVCRLLQAKPADSIAPLQSVLTDEKSTWAQPAHFYLAKAYIQTGDLEHAEAQLQAAAALLGRLTTEAASELSRLQAIRARQEKQKNSDASRP